MIRDCLRRHCEVMCKKFEKVPTSGTYEEHKLVLDLLNQTEWIPVSERLPEKTGLYLVSIGDLVTTGNFDGHNFRTQTMVRFVPDAWMPLPDPYKAEGGTDKE